MAFSRQTLKAMGFTDDQVQSLIDLHTEVTDNLKAEIKKYKEDAEKLSDVQRQLDEANSRLKAAEKDDYKGKYESEKAAHDKLKADIQTKETKAKKTDIFKAYLKEKGYSDNAITKITKYGGYVDGIELDDEGKITNSDKLMTSVETEWSEYKPQAGTQRHTPVTPPVGGKVQRTKEDIMNITDTAARQKAIAENLSLFTGKE
jgi:tyrosyl-tRNA synthetase